MSIDIYRRTNNLQERLQHPSNEIHLYAHIIDPFHDYPERGVVFQDAGPNRFVYVAGKIDDKPITDEAIEEMKNGYQQKIASRYPKISVVKFWLSTKSI